MSDLVIYLSARSLSQKNKKIQREAVGTIIIADGVFYENVYLFKHSRERAYYALTVTLIKVLMKLECSKTTKIEVVFDDLVFNRIFNDKNLDFAEYRDYPTIKHLERLISSLDITFRRVEHFSKDFMLLMANKLAKKPIMRIKGGFKPVGINL